MSEYIQFENLDKVVASIENLTNTDGIVEVMKDGCLKIEREAKQNCPKDTGRLRGSIESNVSVENGEVVGTIGSNVEYAPYVEYGTGLFSSKGDGRKNVPWFFEDEKGEWHKTSGSHAKPFLIPAMNANKENLIESLQKAFRKGAD